MEVIAIIGAIFLLYLISRFLGRGKTPRQRTNSEYSETPRTTPRPKQNNQTFRPSARPSSTPSIVFKDTSSVARTSQDLTTASLEGLHDAFTGAPLDKRLGLFQCQSCKVYYHSESFEILQEENASRCVSCSSTSIASIVPGAQPTRGRDYTPNVVTLSDYKQHVGSVVTFEGYVHKVNESRRGNDFAVMFENKSWVHGFKLVFFRGAVRKVGGKPYIKRLKGKTVKVRGLVVNHRKFGYEIIVSEKSMILGAK